MSNFVINSSTLGKFINHLRLDQRRVHIKADQSTHTPKHTILLERDIHLIFIRHLHKLPLQLFPIPRGTSQRNLDTCFGNTLRLNQRDTPCETVQSINVHSLQSHFTSNCRDHLGCKLLRQEGHDILIFTLSLHPLRILLRSNWLK